VNGGEASPQLIAEAIAAFSENTSLRKRNTLPVQDSGIIPGITLIGTSPTFYKIPVTSALRMSILSGMYPAQPTVVERCVPPIPDPTLRMRGLVPVVNRKFLLQCFDAFKAFVVSSFPSFITQSSPCPLSPRSCDRMTDPSTV
jgi:hypothetical protein